MTVLGHGRRAYSMWTGTQQTYKQAWLAAKCFQDPGPSARTQLACRQSRTRYLVLALGDGRCVNRQATLPGDGAGTRQA